MSCDWEGNRRSDVALAMHHRLKWFIHLRAQGLSKGDEHPTNTLHTVWYSVRLTVCSKYRVKKHPTGYNRLSAPGCQTGLTAGLTTGCIV